MSDDTLIAERADELFREQRDQNYTRTSRIFAILMVAQWVFSVLVAVVYSPYGWEGKTSSVHLHVWIAVLLGGVISSLPLFLTLTQPASALTRNTVAVAQMLWSALLIHLTGGRIETHFHVFGSLAFLSFYRDWTVLLPATVVVATDHLARQMFWPESVYGIVDPEWWRFLEHAFWVVFEDIVLIAACFVAIHEMRANARSHASVEILGERYARTEKLAAVGQLAASVGHELRNPLAAVRNANTFIGKKLKSNGADPRVLQFNEVIERELDACTKIIGDLLDFARERPLALAPTALRELADAAIALVPPHTIEVHNRIPEDLALATIDREQFRQVLTNLIQNAVEAMESRGRGVVTVDAEHGADGFRVVIEDDGPGIPDKVAASIFEPLFTTKVKGTGLGLAIVAGIVKRHQGTIRLASEVGRGSKFIVEMGAR